MGFFITYLRNNFKTGESGEYNVVPAFEASKYDNQAIAEKHFKTELQIIASWSPSKLQEWAVKQCRTFTCLNKVDYYNFWNEFRRERALHEETNAYYEHRFEQARSKNENDQDQSNASASLQPTWEQKTREMMNEKRPTSLPTVNQYLEHQPKRQKMNENSPTPTLHKDFNLNNEEAHQNLNESFDDEYVTISLTLWDRWYKFLEVANNDKYLHEFNAEKHGIVVCGDGIRSRKNMNKKLYHDLCMAMKSDIKRKEFHEIFDEEIERVDTVLNSSESDMLAAARNITSFSTVSTGRRDRLDFLSDILISVIRDIYKAGSDLSHSETTLNGLVTWPCLKFALYAIVGDTRGLAFFPGEEQLLSMTKQLKNNNTQYDERVRYKSDAVLRCLDKKTGGNMELVLLETSNSYDDTTEKKVNFDFHKGMFGTVAMLKTIADRYNYATFDSFKKLKLYFIHAHTKHLRLWSISCPAPNLFVINREDKCRIPVSFNDDTKILLDYIGFTWTLKERIEETLSTIKVIELAHREHIREYRYKPLPSEMNLSNTVDPSIVKITERIHACYFVEDGPFSSPLEPPPSPSTLNG